ncbi:DNA polymerase III subunit gamma/tau [Shewanella aestuarii]|uniref:DNA-directed DNA polymerase n=1 Tax=Shewanella aestuarii TaxID=1028752 RepID=A0A6G9QK03_9GAMM|nr:DNA polymerase III subunit gamma/tau [Shewanella aestuarii]QIR14856.1 DNA polymerase III subunit gamma/tau [Shewanella aestuarii]
MSYQVLARKWRPAKFEQMVGQSHVLLALTNALSQQRLHHAYLFTGTRGVGKTSLARLFAKGLNCEQGVTANPCGVCSSCEEIAQGRFVDLIEVDAASRTKVDDTRELLDNVQYRPSRGRYKVYLIDEVHMLSRSSFNALLKTLEEPPEHVKFLLATTDPQKLPVTVLSRCLQFNLKSLSQDEIAKQLDFVLTQEQLPHEPQALTLLAKAANGSMRDALSLTDQAIAFGSGQVMFQQVQSMLGSIDEKQVIALLKALCDADIAPLMQTVSKVLAFGADAQEVLRSLLELLHQITLTQFAPSAAQASLYSEQILAFAQQLAPEQVQLYYQMLLAGRKDLPFAPDPKSGLEMALLRAVAFVPEKQTKRWVTQTPAKVDLDKIESSPAENSLQHSTALTKQEVIETRPKSIVDRAVSHGNPLDTVANTTDTIENALSANQDLIVNQDDATETRVAQHTEDNNDDDNSELVAQQAILLSQAQSLGYQAEPRLDDSPEQTSAVAEAPSVPDVHSSENAQMALNDKSTDNASLANQVDLLSSSGKAQNNESHHGNDNLSEALFAASASGADNDYQDYNEMSLSFIDDEQDNQDYFDDYVAYTQQESSDTIVATESQQPVIPQSSSADVKTEHNQSDEDPLDDILDRVIASRNALLADVNALKSGDETSIKPSSNKTASSPLAPQKSELKQQPSTSDLAKEDLTDQLKQQANQGPLASENHLKAPLTNDLLSVDAFQPTPIIEQEPASVALQTDSVFTTVKPINIEPNESVNTKNESYDRPPWEAPSEAEIQQQEQDAQSLLASSKTAHVNDLAPVQPAPIENKQLEVSAQTSLSTTVHQITGNQLDLDWYKIMAEVKVGGRVRQLGVNSLCEAIESPLKLLLKPDQKHLSAEVAIEQLQDALSNYLGTDIQVEVEIGQNPSRETPLELRKRFHRELLQQAQQSILTDSNIQWMINHLAAQLDQDSVVYPAEQLTGVAEQIPARLN